MHVGGAFLLELSIVFIDRENNQSIFDGYQAKSSTEGYSKIIGR